MEPRRPRRGSLVNRSGVAAADFTPQLFYAAKVQLPKVALNLRARFL
jgi:hypothetical protein